MGFGGDLVVAIAVAAEAVVVDKEFVGKVREVVKEVEEGVAGHLLHYVGWVDLGLMNETGGQPISQGLAVF